jgi:hypothetical protein
MLKYIHHKKDAVRYRQKRIDQFKLVVRQKFKMNSVEG